MFSLLPACCCGADCLFRGIAVIPKSNNAARLAQNLDVLGFDMTQDELQSISALDKGLRFNDPGFYLPNHPLRIF
jgi:D-xylose reductase